MFAPNASTTVGQLIDELDHFLSFKRTTADAAKELPTEGVLLEYTKKIIGRFESAFAAPVAKTIRESWTGDSADKDQPTVVDFWAYTMLDVAAADESIAIVSWTGETPAQLLVLGLDCKSVEEHKYVQHVVLKDGCPPDTPILDILIRTALLQDARAPVQQRWQEAPESFRSQHLICPACHSGFLELFRGGDYGEKPGHFTCHSCDWSSKGKYYYHSELSSKTAYRKELKFIHMVKDIRDTLHHAEESMDAGIEYASLAFKRAVTVGGPTPEVKELVARYIERLTTLQQEWTLMEKGKKGSKHR